MVQYQRYYQLKKHEEPFKNEESQTLDLECANFGHYRRTRPKLLSLFFLSLFSCTFILAANFFGSFSSSSLLYSFGLEDYSTMVNLCSSVSNGTICCDRSSFRSDICYMKGDIRTHSASSSIFLYNSRSRVNSVSKTVEDDEEEVDKELQHEKIRPYTRKWETSTMDNIDELHLISKKGNLRSYYNCDVRHDVPAVFFSTGGYTGNIYHEFNDGIIPLYITSQHFNKKVVFVILEYHSWWITKYGDILSCLTDYPVIDFGGDKQTHCFPEVIVGLRIHDELTVDPSMMESDKRKVIFDFRNLLDEAYWPRIKGLIQEEEREAQEKMKEKLSLSPSSQTSYFDIEVQEDQFKKPKLVILSRNGSREITNENFLVKMAEKIGFQVEVLRPERTSELAKIYRVLNSSEVMIGVHGAALTHFLFLKPDSVFIQVVPLGIEWAAETYFKEPARKLDLRYIGYEILPEESSLYGQYDEDDPILRNPKSINKKGWEYTKKIYLDGQNVLLDLKRFQKHLVHAYDHSIFKMNLQYTLQ
ncbi:EGF domain-specific O-linked N-acetylglucosamine transferase [Quillaja saponaria]|uniref:EGF domain-specific O-linked N-acetylglucosamine transferase n=1 Tax=Quillaja saponaria TaxID=32244 RepID=A0AAD7PZS6_QUISA|nr:EGF domain-specific O-linked N-acetylglucosamine transferase [Quillaja saponaria]